MASVRQGKKCEKYFRVKEGNAYKIATFQFARDYIPVYSHEKSILLMLLDFKKLFVEVDFIWITRPCKLHPPTPNFHKVKLGFTRVYIIIIFIFCSKT